MTEAPRPQGRRPLVAGNWKMNGLRKDLAEADKICAATAAGEAGDAEVVLCLPATLLAAAAASCEAAGVGLGGQHCHGAPAGPFTGDISAEMLKDAGAAYVILGHSERRAGHNEGNASVREKSRAAFRAGLVAIVCVGETRAQREAGDAMAIVGSQLTGSIPGESTPETLVIAYEPVWAIGTGLTPTLKDIADMHRFIRERVEADIPGVGGNIRILYGGSVKPGNAADILSTPNVDGALVGGASLIAKDFMGVAGVFQDRRLAS
ncbi:triose-phosphate isomerase [Methylocella sp.]|uniref:triose-phosphate isomerase n=1 Tax=Methylocella sp. TaxID=1978226 RepID=UPI0035AFE296